MYSKEFKLSFRSIKIVEMDLILIFFKDFLFCLVYRVNRNWS